MRFQHPDRDLEVIGFSMKFDLHNWFHPLEWGLNSVTTIFPMRWHFPLLVLELTWQSKHRKLEPLSLFEDTNGISHLKKCIFNGTKNGNGIVPLAYMKYD